VDKKTKSVSEVAPKADMADFYAEDAVQFRESFNGCLALGRIPVILSAGCLGLG